MMEPTMLTGEEVTASPKCDSNKGGGSSPGDSAAPQLEKDVASDTCDNHAAAHDKRRDEARAKVSKLSDYLTILKYIWNSTDPSNASKLNILHQEAFQHYRSQCTYTGVRSSPSVDRVPTYLAYPKRGEDVVYVVQVYKHDVGLDLEGRLPNDQFSAEVIIRGDQLMSSLRDNIVCVCDLHPLILKASEEKADYPSAFFFIKDRFYNDMRAPSATDLTKCVRKQLQTMGYPIMPSKKMEDVSLVEVDMHLGQPGIYVHQGSCKHMFMIREMRLSIVDDNFLISGNYLSNRAGLCHICEMYEMEWFVCDLQANPRKSAHLCNKCFLIKFYNIECDKLGLFQGYRYRVSGLDSSNRDYCLKYAACCQDSSVESKTSEPSAENINISTPRQMTMIQVPLPTHFESLWQKVEQPSPQVGVSELQEKLQQPVQLDGDLGQEDALKPLPLKEYLEKKTQNVGLATTVRITEETEEHNPEVTEQLEHYNGPEEGPKSLAVPEGQLNWNIQSGSYFDIPEEDKPVGPIYLSLTECPFDLIMGKEPYLGYSSSPPVIELEEGPIMKPISDESRREAPRFSLNEELNGFQDLRVEPVQRDLPEEPTDKLDSSDKENSNMEPARSGIASVAKAIGIEGDSHGEDILIQYGVPGSLPAVHYEEVNDLAVYHDNAVNGNFAVQLDEPIDTDDSGDADSMNFDGNDSVSVGNSDGNQADSEEIISDDSLTDDSLWESGMGNAEDANDDYSDGSDNEWYSYNEVINLPLSAFNMGAANGGINPLQINAFSDTDTDSELYSDSSSD